MRVFILCTGRSGSTSIIHACQHISNFTAAHESQAKVFGDKRLDYPDQHIEADNRLSWHLGQLDKKYGDEPIYVFMKRDRDKVAKSFTNRYYTKSIIDAFCEGIRMRPAEHLSPQELEQACYDYVDTVNSNITHFLKDKSCLLYTSDAADE